MRYFDEDLVANSRIHRTWWNELNFQREAFHNQEEVLAAMAADHGLAVNGAAVLPRDAWLEFDEMTGRVMRDDDGSNFMTDLMPLARPVNIGKLQFMTRVSGDAGIVRRQMSGQVPEIMGKVEYDYRSAIVPIFNTGYGRGWREWNTLESENFDALADDQEAHLSAIRKNQADYVLNGDNELTFNNVRGFGIRNHPLSKSLNIGPTGANIDLTNPQTTSDAIDNFFTQTLGAMLDTNLVTKKVNIYVSGAIARNMDRSYSGSAGFKGGRLIDYLESNRRINKIVSTNMLTGNEFFGFVPDSQYIRPLVGMAVSTTSMVRVNPVDDYNFMVMGALGIDIRADFNGKSGVFFSVTA